MGQTALRAAVFLASTHRCQRRLQPPTPLQPRMRMSPGSVRRGQSCSKLTPHFLTRAYNSSQLATPRPAPRCAFPCDSCAPNTFPPSRSPGWPSSQDPSEQGRIDPQVPRASQHGGCAGLPQPPGPWHRLGGVAGPVGHLAEVGELSLIITVETSGKFWPNQITICP